MSYRNKFKYDNKLYIQRHICISSNLSIQVVYPQLHQGVPANTCCMSTDSVVYPGTHNVHLQPRHILDVSLDSVPCLNAEIISRNSEQIS